ncbi:MAG: universal stress protein [Ferruginibacter sp.]
MKKNILVLTDFSQNAKSAEEYALQLAIKAEANLILYNAYPFRSTIPVIDNLSWPHDPPVSSELQSINNLQSSVYELETKLSKIKDGNDKPEIHHMGNAGVLTHKLNDFITQKNIWLVVMGTRGESLTANLLFGSNVFSILKSIDRPVLIIPENSHFKDLEKIAYATDLKSPDANIIKWLDDISLMLKLKLFVMHASPDAVSTKATANQSISEQVALAKLNSHISINFSEGQSIEEVLHQITDEFGVGLLALVHRKYGFFENLFHVSTARKMVKHTKIPILIFPGEKL